MRPFIPQTCLAKGCTQIFLRRGLLLRFSTNWEPALCLQGLHLEDTAAQHAQIRV